MPYVVEKVPGGYKVCKDKKTLRDKKDCFSKLPLSSSNARAQQRALYASEHGPRSNANPKNAKFNVQVQGNTKIFGTAKKIAPFVSQLTGVGASQIIDRLKSGAFHAFPNDVTVSSAAKYRGEGVLDWLTKTVGNTLFKAKTPEGAPAVSSTTNQVKASFPTDTKTLYEMNKNAYANNCSNVGDWECMSGTKLLQFYKKANNIIICVRGTASLQDLVADIKIAFQNLTGSSRFKEDVATIQQFQQQYPPSQYNYYFTGHSLGGALIDEFLKLGLGISAISFNPAVQKEFYNTFNHHRIYNTQDPLYDLMGKHVPSAEVREYKGPQEQSFLSKLIGSVPIIGDAQKALKGHSLDNYIGGRMLIPSVIDRPYLRGAGPGLYSSSNWLDDLQPRLLGNGWLDDLGKGFANFVMPAISLGTIKGEDALKGDFKPRVENALPYLMKTGSNLLSAKMGDPSGLIEQAIDQSQGKGKRIKAGARCRWVDKGTKYPDWQEVCDGGGLYYDNPKYGRIYCANCD